MPKSELPLFCLARMYVFFACAHFSCDAFVGVHLFLKLTRGMDVYQDENVLLWSQRYILLPDSCVNHREEARVLPVITAFF